MNETPENQSQSQDGPAVSPKSPFPVSEIDALDDLVPPFSVGRARTEAGAPERSGPTQTQPQGAAGEVQDEAHEATGSFVPDFLDDEPWAGDNRSQVSAGGGSPPEARKPVGEGLEETVRRGAQRLEDLADRLRAAGGDLDSLRNAAGDDALALLVVGFLFGEHHAE